MKIVIADDDQNLLAMLVPHLEYLGHTVLLAVNGAEFLSKITENTADLLISDINLPVFDGIELYRKTRELPAYAAVPFILWSGIEMEKGAATAAKDSRLRFLRKPFSLAVLKTVMDDLVNTPLFGDNDQPGGTPLKF